jgi:TraM recognition site of TraD and TraG
MISKLIDWFESQVCVPPPGDDASPLLRFDNGTEFTEKDSYSGIGIMGGIDSGKTSLARTLRQSLLGHGYGLLILCVKNDEAETWEKEAIEMGRGHDFVRFRVGGGHRFDPFFGLDPVEAVAALEDVNSVLSSGTDTSGDSAYWKAEAKKFMRNAATLVFHATGYIDLREIAKVCTSYAKDVDQVKSKAWQERSACYKNLLKAEQRSSGNQDVALAREFFLETFPSYGSRAQGSVLSITGNLLENFRREPFTSLFSGRSNVSTDDILERGKIVCVDVPVLEKDEVGTIVNSIWLFFFCRALTKRKSRRPAAIYVDEAQFLLCRELQRRQTVIRTHNVATVILFQNIPVLKDYLNEQAVTGLLSTLNTLIFTRQQDDFSRQWASNRISMRRKYRKTENQSHTPGRSAGVSYSESTELVWDHKFHPSVFVDLKNGGKKHGYKVESIVQTADKAFRASWHQKRPGSKNTVKPIY